MIKIMHSSEGGGDLRLKYRVGAGTAISGV